MTTPLTDIAGIGPSAAKVLQAHNINSAEDLAAASVAEITAVPGFGEIRAQRIKEAAAAAIQPAESAAEPAPAENKNKKESGEKEPKKEKKSKEEKGSKKKKEKKGKKKK